MSLTSMLAAWGTGRRGDRRGGPQGVRVGGLWGLGMEGPIMPACFERRDASPDSGHVVVAQRLCRHGANRQHHDRMGVQPQLLLQDLLHLAGPVGARACAPPLVELGEQGGSSHGVALHAQKLQGVRLLHAAGVLCPGLHAERRHMVHGGAHWPPFQPPTAAASHAGRAGAAARGSNRHPHGVHPHRAAICLVRLDRLGLSKRRARAGPVYTSNIEVCEHSVSEASKVNSAETKARPAQRELTPPDLCP
jgi:hypothetical protein